MSFHLTTVTIQRELMELCYISPLHNESWTIISRFTPVVDCQELSFHLCTSFSLQWLDISGQSLYSSSPTLHPLTLHLCHPLTPCHPPAPHQHPPHSSTTRWSTHGMSQGDIATVSADPPPCLPSPSVLPPSVIVSALADSRATAEPGADKPATPGDAPATTVINYDHLIHVFCILSF